MNYTQSKYRAENQPSPKQKYIQHWLAACMQYIALTFSCRRHSHASLFFAAIRLAVSFAIESFASLTLEVVLSLFRSPLYLCTSILLSSDHKVLLMLKGGRWAILLTESPSSDESISSSSSSMTDASGQQPAQTAQSELSALSKRIELYKSRVTAIQDKIPLRTFRFIRILQIREKMVQKFIIFC